MQGFKLTFFTQQDRSVHGQSLALWLLEQAKEIGIRGATLTAFTHPNHIAYLCSWGLLSCRLAATPITLGINTHQ